MEMNNAMILLLAVHILFFIGVFMTTLSSSNQKVAYLRSKILLLYQDDVANWISKIEIMHNRQKL